LTEQAPQNDGSAERGRERPPASRFGDLQAHLAAIVESSLDAIIGKTLDGTIISWNRGAEELYGYRAEEAIGRSISILAPPDRVHEMPELIDRISRGERVRHYETRQIRKDGRPVEVLLTLSPTRDRDGEIAGASLVARDITELKRVERELASLAYTDDLTGLANRRRFIRELKGRAEYAARYERPAALLMLDLDELKAINDTLGHGAGDRVIHDVAELLRERLRSTDFIARLGGDEFAVILPEADERSAEIVAQALLDELAAWPVSVDPGRRMTMSIGIALIAGGVSAEEAMIRADSALYEAKGAGRGRAVSYSPEPTA
jgi:diguanylate cyclase (GGDEF)-like protein/PAS domain S-box-containing protein